MPTPPLDSKFDKYTDAVWSATRALAFGDVLLRGVQHFVHNEATVGLLCPSPDLAARAALCRPHRDPLTDLYAGATVYMGVVLAVGCVGSTLRNVLRDPQALDRRLAAGAPHAASPPALMTPRDRFGWTANAYIAAIMCGLHGFQGYTLNTAVKNSHGLRLLTGCVMGAGLILGIASKVSFVTQLLPASMQEGRGQGAMPGPVGHVLGDPKMAAIAHMGASLLYSSIAAAAQPAGTDPWRYNWWGAPVVAAAAVADMVTVIALAAVNARRSQAMCAKYPAPSSAVRDEQDGSVEGGDAKV